MQHAESILWFKEELLIELSNYNVSIIVCVPEAAQLRGRIGNQIELVEVKLKRRSINPASDVFLFLKYLNVIKVYKPDLILTNAIKPNIYGNLASRYFKIQVISNVPGVGTIFQNRKGFLFHVVRLLFRKAFESTHKVIFENHENQELYIELNLVSEENSIVVKGSGVNVEKFSPRFIEKHTDDFTFLLIGRVMPDKGIYEYVEAARLLKDKYPKVKFKLLGMVEDENLLKYVLDCLFIEYIGVKNDVRDDIASADCVLLPSHHEGMANTLLEAASMGKPLIASNISGCKEIIDEGLNGYLCKVRDTESLASAMEKMLNISEVDREMMGQYGRNKMIVEFNRKDVVDSYINAITEIIGPIDLLRNY